MHVAARIVLGLRTVESWRNSSHSTRAKRGAPRERRKVERMSLKLDSLSAVLQRSRERSPGVELR